MLTELYGFYLLEGASTFPEFLCTRRDYNHYRKGVDICDGEVQEEMQEAIIEFLEVIPHSLEMSCTRFASIQELGLTQILFLGEFLVLHFRDCIIVAILLAQVLNVRRCILHQEIMFIL